MEASRIELWIGGIKKDVTPIYGDKISLDKERDSEEMYYRTKLNGSVKFVGPDFDLVEGQSLDTEMRLKVFGMSGSLPLVEGRFTKMDCTFNYDDKVVEVKVTSVDVYDKILGGMSNEYDLISLAPERKPVTLTKRAILQVYRLRDTKITNVIGNMSYEVDVNSDVDIEGLTEETLQNTYKFKKTGDKDFCLELNGLDTAGIYGDLSLANGIYIGYKTAGMPDDVTLTRADGSTRFTIKGYKLPHGDDYSLIIYDGDEPFMRGIYYVGTKPFNNFYWDTWNSVQMYWVDSQREPVAIDTPIQGATCDIFHLNTFTRLLLPKSVEGATKLTASNSFVEYNLNYTHILPFDVNEDTTAGGTFIRSLDVQDEPTKWGVNGDGKYFVKPNGGSASYNVIPIGYSTWIPFSIWFVSRPLAAQEIDSTYNSEFVLNDAYPLYSAIQVLLAKIDDTITFEPTAEYSQFLFGTLPSGAIPSHKAQSLYVTPITNVKRTYYDQAARKGIMTLKNIFDMLRSTMQLYWFIDSQNRLRIEHILWFKNGGSYSSGQTPLIDLTSIVSPMWMKTWSKGTNNISYEPKDLVKRYEFAWAEETSEVFDGYAMDIKNPYAKDGKTLNSTIQRFISDMDLVMSAPDVLSDDLFALIGTKEVSGVQKCPIAYISHLRGHAFLCPYYGMQNAYLSFFFLEQIYWTYNMGGSDVVPEGYYGASGSDGSISVDGIQRVKKQNVRFPITIANIGVEGLIKTDIGNGQWTKASYNLESGMVDMDIVLDIEDENNA